MACAIFRPLRGSETPLSLLSTSPFSAWLVVPNDTCIHSPWSSALGPSPEAGEAGCQTCPPQTPPCAFLFCLYLHLGTGGHRACIPWPACKSLLSGRLYFQSVLSGWERLFLGKGFGARRTGFGRQQAGPGRAPPALIGPSCVLEGAFSGQP